MMGNDPFLWIGIWSAYHYPFPDPPFFTRLFADPEPDPLSLTRSRSRSRIYAYYAVIGRIADRIPDSGSGSGSGQLERIRFGIGK